MSMAGIFFIFNVMGDLSLQHTGSLVVCGTQAPECTGSGVVAHRLSCSVASYLECGILCGILSP